MTPRRPNSSARQALTPNARQAFTLLEVLIAISVIVILVGILFISFKSVGNSAKAKQTVINFEILKTMLDQARQVDTNLLSRSQILPAPGGISDPGTRDDNNRNQVLYTRYVMAKLMRVPEVKKTFEQLQTSQLLGRTPLAAPDNTISASGTYYVSDRVKEGTTNYICIGFVDGSAAAITLPLSTNPNPNFVDESTIDSAPVLLDGWGNPILAVPNRGLMHARKSSDVLGPAWSSGTSYDTSSANKVKMIVDSAYASFQQNFVCISSHISDTTAGSGNNAPIDVKWAASVTAPNNRPFFVSAGPDGIVGYVSDTVKGADDNVYSFEN